MWLVATAGRTAPGTYAGTPYRTTGPPFNAVPFDPARAVATAGGTATLTFTDGNNGTFAYTVNGETQQKAITRQIFTAPGTVCQYLCARESFARWCRRRAGDTGRRLCLDELLLPAEPALEMGLGGRGLAAEDLVRGRARRLDQTDVALRIGEAQQRHARLTRAQEFAGPADQQILPGDLEPVVCAVDHLQTRLRGFRHRLLEEQHAGAFLRAAAHAAAQLMKLREAEALGVLYHHQGRVGHIDADFDHRGGDQHADLAADEALHGRRFFIRLHPAVQKPNGQLRQLRRQLGVERDRGLQLQLFRFLDQRAHPVDLTARGTQLPGALDDFRAAPLTHEPGSHGRAPGRHLVDHRYIEVGVEAHGERARDRRRAHHQLVRIGDAFLAE